MRVLITGASGFIGRHCVEALLKRGCEVHAVSRGLPVGDAPGLIWHQADILQPTGVTDVFSECKPTHLIHAAWNVTNTAFLTSAENLLWAARSIDLLYAAQRHGVQRVVGIGTCAEYGLNHDLCDEHSTPMHPVGMYAQTKYATQVVFDAAAQAHGLSTAWARLFFPYGFFDKPTKLIPYTIRQLSKGEPAEFSSGEQVRDLLFASDVGAAIVALLFSEVAGSVNIASGVAIRVCDVVRRIGELMGRPEFIRLGVRQTHDLQAKRWVASVNRLGHEIKWHPTMQLDDGLRATIAAFCEVRRTSTKAIA